MRKLVWMAGLAVLVLGCGETATGTGGSAGGGAAGAGGTPPPPPQQNDACTAICIRDCPVGGIDPGRGFEQCVTSCQQTYPAYVNCGRQADLFNQCVRANGCNTGEGEACQSEAVSLSGCLIAGDPPAPLPCSNSPACVFCPASALDPTVGALFPDGFLAAVTFTAEADSVDGTTMTVAVAATSSLDPLPVSVTATLSDASTTTYSATAGGTGSFDIAVPEQVLSGMYLTIDAGAGTGDVEVDANATEVTIQMTSAVFDLALTDPMAIPLRLDASADGPCEMLGDGVSIPVP